MTPNNHISPTLEFPVSQVTECVGVEEKEKCVERVELLLTIHGSNDDT